MRLIDTHCHTHSKSYRHDAGAAIERARAAGVELILTLGEDADDTERAIALADRHEGVLAAAGIHPHNAKDATPADLARIEAIAAHERVAAIGEIGLDYYRNLSPRDVQIDVVRAQLAIAARAGKPVAVHTREAHGDMLPLLREWSRSMGGALPGGRPLGVMHYFDGDLAAANEYAQLGFLISINTVVTRPKSAVLRELARDLPLEQMVLETDSPYGTPQPHIGTDNEPAWVVEAARTVAELRGLSVAQVAEATTANAERLLGIRIAAGGAA